MNRSKIKVISTIRFYQYSCLLISLLLAISGCAAKMSLEEAKKISVIMDEKPLVKPPRHINDILAALSQRGQFDASATKRFQARMSSLPPSGANDGMLARFYQERGHAEWQLGFMNKARDDFNKSLMYNERMGRENPALLRSLGIVEKYTGNFKKAVELLEESLDIQPDMAAYPHLVDAYIVLGDLEKAEKLSRESVELYSREMDRPVRDRRRSGKRGGRNQGVGHVIPMSDYVKAVYMNSIMASVLDAQGRYAEAEQYLRKELELHHSQAVVERIPLFAIRNRLLLSANLANQHRFIDAEIEARLTLKESLGHGGIESEMTSRAVLRLAGVMRSQGRLKDAEQLAHASIRILETSGFPSDSEYMGNARMFLGNILCQEEEFPEAMKQFDLVREAMKDNAYLYEKMVTRNSSLMLTLLKTGRRDEAMRIISSGYEWNRKNLGDKHPRTILTVGLRGMANSLAGADRQAFADLSAALPVLMRQGGKADASNQLPRAILETYIDFLGRIYGTPLEKELGVRAADESFRIVSFLGSRSVQTALGESSARAAAAYDPELADLVRREQDLNKQIAGLQETLSDAMMAPPDQQNPKALGSLKAEIEGLITARSTILAEINKRFPKYANFTSPEPVAVDKVRENLQPNEALISIYSAEEKTYTWAMTKTGESRFSVTSLGRKELAKTVSELRKALDPNPSTLGDIPPFDLVKAHHLYRSLLQPVAPAWKEATDLLIAVDGPLGNLPFSILPTEPFSLAVEKGELFANYREVPWLIRKASVTMLPSVRTLVTLRSLPAGDQKRKAFAGFGDPVFSLEQLGRDGSAKSTAPVNKETAAKNIRIAGRGLKLQVRGVRIAGKGNLDDDRMISTQI
ncbi:MAG: CHAT domain-containing protein, partial [Syntrophales bacterium]|nr:CHAT domain-containing protein [Syntrophales bacterium]